jgi:hypothetical protein
MAVTPMKDPGLMSATEDLTIAVIRALSASFTIIVLPSRALMVSMLPSTFSIWPRMRIGGVCAKEAVAVKVKARATAPKVCRAL